MPIPERNSSKIWRGRNSKTKLLLYVYTFTWSKHRIQQVMYYMTNWVITDSHFCIIIIIHICQCRSHSRKGSLLRCLPLHAASEIFLLIFNLRRQTQNHRHIPSCTFLWANKQSLEFDCKAQSISICLGDSLTLSYSMLDSPHTFLEYCVVCTTYTRIEN